MVRLVAANLRRLVAALRAAYLEAVPEQQSLLKASAAHLELADSLEHFGEVEQSVHRRLAVPRLAK